MKIKCILNFFRIFYILQVATTQKLQRFTVNGCVVICGVTAVQLECTTTMHNELKHGKIVGNFGAMHCFPQSKG